MTETVDAEMEASEAAHLLAGLEGFEDQLTARTAGLTWMVWGTAIPGLLVTYHAAAASLETTGFAWILSSLWIPWILGASLTTNWLWKATAVQLDGAPASREGWVFSLVATLVFLALAGAIWAASGALGVELATYEWITVAGGLLTTAVGLFYHRARTPGVGEAVLAGLAITLGGLGLAAASWSPIVFEVLAAAGLAGSVYYAAGIRLFLKGYHGAARRARTRPPARPLANHGAALPPT